VDQLGREQDSEDASRSAARCPPTSEGEVFHHGVVRALTPEEPRLWRRFEVARLERDWVEAESAARETCEAMETDQMLGNYMWFLL
jgi:hypothetical protein